MFGNIVSCDTIIDDMSQEIYPNHSYADDTTLHYSMSFDRHPSQQKL